MVRWLRGPKRTDAAVIASEIAKLRRVIIDCEHRAHASRMMIEMHARKLQQLYQLEENDAPPEILNARLNGMQTAFLMLQNATDEQIDDAFYQGQDLRQGIRELCNILQQEQAK